MCLLPFGSCLYSLHRRLRVLLINNALLVRAEHTTISTTLSRQGTNICVPFLYKPRCIIYKPRYYMRGRGVEAVVQDLCFGGLSAPYVSWALEGPRWPQRIATVGSLGALPWPGCASTRANWGSGWVGRMYAVLGRRHDVTPPVHRQIPFHG